LTEWKVSTDIDCRHGLVRRERERDMERYGERERVEMERDMEGDMERERGRHGETWKEIDG